VRAVAELLAQPVVVLEALLGLDVDQVHEVVEGAETGRVGDVVDEQEGVRFEGGGGPEPAVFLLSGGVGDGEEVGDAVDGAGDGVGVFCSEWMSMGSTGEGSGRRVPIVGSYLSHAGS
jgi:hypothetical protein